MSFSICFFSSFCGKKAKQRLIIDRLSCGCFISIMHEWSLQRKSRQKYLLCLYFFSYCLFVFINQIGERIAMYTQLLFIFLLAAAILHFGQAQNWTGAFKASPCKLKNCCCFTGNLVIKKVPSKKLQIQVSLDPQTCLTQTSQSVTIPAPIGYTISTNLFNLMLSVKLSSNSRIISASSSPSVICTQTYTRVWSREKYLKNTK